MENQSKCGGEKLQEAHALNGKAENEGWWAQGGKTGSRKTEVERVFGPHVNTWKSWRLGKC